MPRSLAAPADPPRAIVAHDKEHAWRSAGEWAIRQEMERRIEAWLKTRGTPRQARAA